MFGRPCFVDLMRSGRKGRPRTHNGSPHRSASLNTSRYTIARRRLAEMALPSMWCPQQVHHICHIADNDSRHMSYPGTTVHSTPFWGGTGSALTLQAVDVQLRFVAQNWLTCGKWRNPSSQVQHSQRECNLCSAPPVLCGKLDAPNHDEMQPPQLQPPPKSPFLKCMQRPLCGSMIY
jgi:hypothetical protein